VTSRDPETDRKNLLYTVKWFCEEFKDNKQVGLIVKSNLGTSCVFHRMQLEQMFGALVKEVRQGEYPRVYLLNGDMSDADCASLMVHPKVKALVSFTRGEGYGLPIVDAAAAGLPVIATGWSGHLEFLKHGKFSKVSYDLMKVPHEKLDKSIFVEGSSWAMPHETDAKKRMRKMYESQAVPRQWAVELREKIQREFSFAAVSKRYDEVIGRAS
jgi:glycosyltransferase involved in cell wall biosynthesis